MNNLLDDIEDAFSGFNWENALEIAFITLVLFWLLRLLRGTSAMTVVKGISLVTVVVVVLSRALDSIVFDWIVNNAIAVIVLFILIVFQPEFRRALEKVGRVGGVRAWFGFAHDPARDAVSIVAQVTARLSDNKTGALIVFERETGLLDVVESGVGLDAVVTGPLLEGIFFPNSPLHDGAVVLRDDRILAASCILPTSDYRATGSDHLGTRHRAAVGITEHTDAVVVVVSEETGGIALAMDGRLLRLVDSERLEAMLVPLMHVNNRSSSDENGRGRGDRRRMPALGS
jgi:diadenylate cyclase